MDTEYSDFMDAFREMVKNKTMSQLEWAYKSAGQPFQEENWKEQMMCNYIPNDYDEKEIKDILGDNSMENMLEAVHYMYSSEFKQFSLPLYYFFREMERNLCIDMMNEGVFDEEIERIKQNMKV